MEHFIRHRQRAVILLFAAAFQTSVFASESQSMPADVSVAGQPADALVAGAETAGGSTTLDFANGLYARKMYVPAIAEYEKFLKDNPRSSEAASARFRFADSFYFTKDYASAIAHFELFLKGYPDDKRIPMARFRLGTARYYQGNVARAIRELAELSRHAEDPVLKSGALFYLAKSLEEKGSPARSLEILRSLAAQPADSEYAAYAGVALGDAHLKTGDLDAALREGYLPASGRSGPGPLVLQAQFKVAEIYFSKKQYGQAAEFYEKVLVSSEDSGLKDKALLGLFYCDYYEGRIERAQRRWAVRRPEIESGEHRAEIIFLFASLLADQKQYDEALKKLEDVIAGRDADRELKEKAQFKKIAVLSQMGQKEVSLAALEQYFSSLGAADQSTAARALSQKAELLAEIGRTDEALAAFGRARRDYPGTEYAKSALYQSAVALVKAGRLQEAKKDFQGYASLYPADEDADLALLQAVQTDLDAKNFAEAFRGAEEFLRKNPQSPHLDIAYYKLGVASTGLGRHGHASFAFAKVTDDFPSSKLYTESLYGTAVSFENAGKLDQAIPLYERLLREWPEHALSRELLPRLGYLYIENKDFGKALTHTENLLFKDTGAPLETDGVFWIVQYLLDQGLYDRLDRILDALPARFPDKDLTHETFFFRAERAMGMKDYALAKSLYASAIGASPEEGRYVPHAYLGRGTAEAALNENDPASLDFTQALRYDREIKISMRARFELANLRLKSRDYEGASKDFMLVAILYDDPKYTPPALYKAGECFERIGRKDEAAKAFSELTAKYPESDWARKAQSAER